MGVGGGWGVWLQVWGLQARAAVRSRWMGSVRGWASVAERGWHRGGGFEERAEAVAGWGMASPRASRRATERSR